VTSPSLCDLLFLPRGRFAESPFLPVGTSVHADDPFLSEFTLTVRQYVTFPVHLALSSREEDGFGHYGNFVCLRRWGSWAFRRSLSSLRLDNPYPPRFSPPKNLAFFFKVCPEPLQARRRSKICSPCCCPFWPNKNAWFFFFFCSGPPPSPIKCSVLGY